MEEEFLSTAVVGENNSETDSTLKGVEEVEGLEDDADYMEDNSVKDKVSNVEHQVEEPSIGRTFANVDKMFAFYKNYGKHKGFPVKRRTSKKGDDGVVRYVTFTCGRAGKSRSKSSNPLKPRLTMKTDCKARLGGSLDADGRWRINSFNLEHNHGLNTCKARYFRCNRESISYIERRLETNKMAGSRLNQNTNSFVVEDGHGNSSSEDGCRNYEEKVRQLKLAEGDAIAIQNLFLKMQAQNSNFFYSMDFDGKGRLKNVFWADPRSRAAYKEFGEVITFDTTYLANKYDIPLVLFVGVNHHGESILLGCGLISCDDSETFTWLFGTWLTCMSGCAPNGIITDQDKAMKKAIEIIFPTARHRWCLFHIMKKLPEKLGSHKHYESIILSLRSAVHDSQSPEEFEENWRTMIEMFALNENEWLTELFSERRRWVPCFVKDSFWAGMSITQRGESISAFFSGYVNSKTTLKQFVEQYVNALESKLEKESHDDYRSAYKQVPCVTAYDEIEKQAQEVYTISKFKEFQVELTGKMYCDFISFKEDCMILEYDIREDIVVGDGKKRVIFKVSFHRDECEVKCSCKRFEFRGILCRHALAVLIRNDVLRLPDKYLLRRWRKDVRRCHTRVKVNYDGRSATVEQIRFDKMCTEFTKVADLAAVDGGSYSCVMDWIENVMKDLPKRDAASGHISQVQTFQLPPTMMPSTPNVVCCKWNPGCDFSQPIVYNYGSALQQSQESNRTHGYQAVDGSRNDSTPLPSSATSAMNEDQGMS